MPSDMPRRLRGLFPLIGLLILAACADTRGGSIPYDRPLSAPDEMVFQTLATDYKIAPMDKLAIKVFKMDDLTADYDVDLAGNISLPLVGQVQAANLTTAQLDDLLTQKLGEKYLEHPDVSVAIKSSTAHVVTVDGAVKEAGSFPVGGPTSLIRAITMAKGTTEDANARRVAVFRTIGGKRLEGCGVMLEKRGLRVFGREQANQQFIEIEAAEQRLAGKQIGDAGTVQATDVLQLATAAKLRFQRQERPRNLPNRGSEWQRRM